MNLLISFSGGETSAYMTKWLLENVKDKYNEVCVIFANTGQEHEQTLQFVELCDKFFGFNVIWVDPVQHFGENKAASHKVVTYQTACRDGRLFEELITKYGIPNQAFPHCTRSLKLAPITSYVRKELGWGNGTYETAIGIRADEIDRMSESSKERGIIYPLITMHPMSKPLINDWWSNQPFRLGLTGYQGNCKWCWKKTFRKHYTIMSETPEVYDFPDDMEKKYGFVGPEFKKENPPTEPRTFFRGKKSTKDLRNDYEKVKNTFIPFHDENKVFTFEPEFDLGGGCGESCEVYADIPENDRIEL